MKKYVFSLIGILLCAGAIAADSVDIQERFFTSAINSTVPVDKRGAVTAVATTALPSVSVSEMADICDAGFKESSNRLDDAVRFVDAVLGAQAKYDAAVAECAKLKGRLVDDVCVGLDGYKLVYGNVCPNGQVCVTDFTNVVTHMRYVFDQYINGWASQHGVQLTCLDDYRDGGAKHYLQCSARGMPYEFEFARLNATDDEIAAALIPNVKPGPGDDNGGDDDTDVVPGADGMMCPATGNGLTTINENTRVGDICTSNLIAMGTVFMRKNGTCSCSAKTCKTGLAAVSGVCCPGGQEYDTKIKKCAPIKAKEQEEQKNTQTVNVKFYDVCHDGKGKTGGVEHCVKGFFNWVNVQMMGAVELSKEYIRKKHGKSSVCSNQYTQSSNDDYVRCTTTDGKDYFTFQFDDVQESVDKDNSSGAVLGMCKIYGGNTIKGSMTCRNVPSSNIDGLNQFASNFALSVNCEGDKCTFSEKTSMYSDKNSDTLTNVAKIAGLDPCVFYIKAGIQIKSSLSLVEQIKNYAASKMTVNKFSCNAKATQVNSDKTATYCGKNNSANAGYRDDILRCFVNDKPVDFIFDDTTELMKYRDRGGQQAMQCIVMGGVFEGENCHHLTQAQCDKIGKHTRVSYQDGKCVLHDANVVDNVNFAAEIGKTSGMAIVGTALAFVPGAQGMSIAVLVDATGAVLELTGTAMAGMASNKFFEESTTCHNKACAEKLIKEQYVRMATLSDNMSDSQVNGIDQEMSRLFTVLGGSHPLVQELAKNDKIVAANPGLKNWEPEEIMVAVGVTLQLATALTSLGKMAFKKFRKTTDIIIDITSDIKALPPASDIITDPARLLGAGDDASLLPAVINKTDDMLPMVIDKVDDVADGVKMLPSGPSGPLGLPTAGVRPTTIVDKNAARYAQQMAKGAASKAAALDEWTDAQKALDEVWSAGTAFKSSDFVVGGTKPVLTTAEQAAAYDKIMNSTKAVRQSAQQVADAAHAINSTANVADNVADATRVADKVADAGRVADIAADATRATQNVVNVGNDVAAAKRAFSAGEAAVIFDRTSVSPDAFRELRRAAKSSGYVQGVAEYGYDTVLKFVKGI